MTQNKPQQKPSNNLRISVILTTYNQPTLLKAALTGLSHQDFDSFEVIIADDGSDEPTQKVIREATEAFHHLTIKHVWAKHDGFRAARMRNMAVKEAEGEYLVFLDGDCLPPPDFLSRHWQLREDGWAVYGQRILASKSYTQKLILSPRSVYRDNYWTIRNLLKLCWQQKINRVFPAVTFNPHHQLRKNKPYQWNNIRGCNFALWKKDYVAINGSDESFCGWGSEDKDVAVRLINAGTGIKDGRCFSYVLHLWHPISNREYDVTHAQIVRDRFAQHIIHPTKGLSS